MMRRLALLTFAATLTACTPQEALYFTFGPGSQHGDPVQQAQAERVAWCESEMKPWARSPTNDHGLMQINAIHRATFERVTGQPWSQVYNPFWNAVYAKNLHDRKGWQPWTCEP